MNRPLRLLLAASGGGHVRQLIDLEPVWGSYQPLIVTEDTALGRSLAAQHDVHFVPHFAIGQARLGAPLRMLRAAFANLVASFRIVRRFKPDVVISTGAGAAFWTAFFARLLGAEFILIESFARFDAPSKFGRIAARLATRKIAQSAKLAAWWPDAEIFDPFLRLDQTRPDKRPLILATVGATLAFPRLSNAVITAARDGALTGEIVLQAGEEAATLPETNNVRTVESLDFETMKALLRQADVVVCHGGTGSLVTALREGCYVIAMPRTVARREHYDDHQEEIVRAFHDRGLVEIAEDAGSLVDAIARARAKPAPMATVDPVALRAYLTKTLAEFARQRGLAVPPDQIGSVTIP